MHIGWSVYNSSWKSTTSEAKTRFELFKKTYGIKKINSCDEKIIGYRSNFEWFKSIWWSFSSPWLFTWWTKAKGKQFHTSNMTRWPNQIINLHRAPVLSVSFRPRQDTPHSHFFFYRNHPVKNVYLVIIVGEKNSWQFFCFSFLQEVGREHLMSPNHRTRG